MWNEEEHPRGQPDNQGQFVKKGTNGKGYDSRSDILPLRKAVEKSSNKKKIAQLERKESEVQRVWQIQENTGMSYEEAEKTYSAIKHYTRTGFRAIRDGHAHKEESIIEKFINKHPKYDGKIYRGIALDKVKGETLISDLKTKKESGGLTDMMGLSSWSSAESIANEFADNRPGEYKFIFELNNQSGVGIDHLSEWQGEEEVLQSGKVKYKVKDIFLKDGKYRIKLEEV